MVQLLVVFRQSYGFEILVGGRFRFRWTVFLHYNFLEILIHFHLNVAVIHFLLSIYFFEFEDGSILDDEGMS